MQRQGEQQRVVLSRRNTGLGDRLVSLCAAWRFARRTGRTLIADWRQSPYLDRAPGADDNLFGHVFDVARGPSGACELAGVPFIGDAALTTELLPAPVWPQNWARNGLVATPWRAPTDPTPAQQAAERMLLASGEDVAAPTVVLQGCHGTDDIPVADAQHFYAALRPKPAIVAMARDALAACGVHKPRIGLHVRNGNGGDIMGHTPYWRSFGAAIGRCEAAVAAARRRLGPDVPVFLATDSAAVEAVLRARIPGVVAYRKYFRPVGAGELHLGPDASRGLVDAMADMLALADCQALIRYPAASFFSLYAALTGQRSGEGATLASLSAPWDDDDPLSPAMLFDARCG